jgi:hypothetical protein
MEMLTPGEINLFELSKGVYFIKIENDKCNHFERVILN